MLPARVDHASAVDCLAMLRSGLKGRPPGSAVTVDGSALSGFDSSAVSVLLEFSREAHAAGHSVVFSSLPPKLRTLATLYGVSGLLSA